MLSSLSHLVGTTERSHFRREFQICYQPVISFADSRLEGFEALIRWQPERTLLYPAEFMPLLEKTGLSAPLGEWLLYETASQLAHWKQQFPFTKPQVSINLSHRQLMSPGLVDVFQDLAPGVKYGEKPLQIEVPLNFLQTDFKAAIGHLEGVCEQGLALCIDDMVPDMTLLPLLQQCPVDTVKLAIAVTQNADPEQQALLKAFVEATRAIGIRTIAKGIETAEQYTTMDAVGCRYGQGFLFDHPLRTTEVVTRLLHTERKAMMSMKAHLTAMYRLNQVIQQWLGGPIITRYWQATKPVRSWLSHWYPNQSPEILTTHYPEDCIAPQQQADLHMWVNRFLHRCHDIVHNLPYLLENSSLAATDLQLMRISKSPQKLMQTAFSSSRILPSNK
ncbi:MAG: EAL domain-containing protein [Cyanobacteria bacterium J06632_22]